MNLEHKIVEELKTGQCSVERALLIVSGLKSEEEVAAYQKKLDLMQEDFEQWCVENRKSRGKSYQTASTLFYYLGVKKPNKYNRDFLLAKVIDNQLNEDNSTSIGNCVGLTSLYSVLGVRLGLDLAVLFDIDHILTILYCGGEILLLRILNVMVSICRKK